MKNTNQKMTLHEKVLYFKELKRKRRRYKQISIITSLAVMLMISIFAPIPEWQVVYGRDNSNIEVNLEEVVEDIQMPNLDILTDSIIHFNQSIDTTPVIKPSIVRGDKILSPAIAPVTSMVNTTYDTEVVEDIRIEEEKKKEEAEKQKKLQEELNTKIYDIPLDAEYQRYIVKMCEKYEVDVEIAFATVYAETTVFEHGKTHKNKDSSIDSGLFQVNSSNIEWMESKIPGFDVTNIYHNIEAGIIIIKDAMSYNSDPYLYMMVYNMGPSNAKENWAVGRYSTEYSRKVVNYVSKLRELKLN